MKTCIVMDLMKKIHAIVANQGLVQIWAVQDLEKNIPAMLQKMSILRSWNVPVKISCVTPNRHCLASHVNAANIF